jgi:hypothetical protein
LEVLIGHASDLHVLSLHYVFFPLAQGLEHYNAQIQELLVKCYQLKILNVSHNNCITSLNSLQNMSYLRELNIQNCYNIQADTLENIHVRKYLDILNIADCPQFCEQQI